MTGGWGNAGWSQGWTFFQSNPEFPNPGPSGHTSGGTSLTPWACRPLVKLEQLRVRLWNFGIKGQASWPFLKLPSLDISSVSPPNQAPPNNLFPPLWNIVLLSLRWSPPLAAPSRHKVADASFHGPGHQRAPCNPLVTRTPSRSRNRLRGLPGLPRPPPATESHPQSQRRPTPILAAFRTGCRSGGGTG